MPLYSALKGSEKRFGAFSAENHLLYPISYFFFAFLDLFQEVVKMSKYGIEGEVFIIFYSEVQYLGIRKVPKYI